MGPSERIARRIRLWRIDSWGHRMEVAQELHDWRSLDYCRRMRSALRQDARQRGWIP